MNTYGIVQWESFLRARKASNCPACFIEAEFGNVEKLLHGHKNKKLRQKYVDLDYDYADLDDDFENPMLDWDDGDPGPRKELI